MPASIPELINGTVELRVVLPDDSALHGGELTGWIKTWVQAVQYGFFGAGSAVPQPIEARPGMVSARLDCWQISQAALDALVRLVRRFSKVPLRAEDLSVSFEGLELSGRTGAASPLPRAIPFALEYPNDLHAAVRVEIEFATAIPNAERKYLYDALAVWDLLVKSFADEKRWGVAVASETRRLSPTIIEHEVVGYFAGFECIDFLGWMAIRLDQRVRVERLTIE